MYGYIRPLKAELKVREYEAYHAMYCGLCRTLGRRYGFAARFLVSYDLITVESDQAGEWDGQIVNRAYYELPHTGGPGAKLYTAVGLLLVTLAGLVLLYRYRKLGKGDGP